MPARTRSRSRGRRTSSGSATSPKPAVDSPSDHQAATKEVENLSPEEAMSESLLQAIFDAYDENGDGVLSLDELAEVRNLNRPGHRLLSVDSNR